MQQDSLKKILYTALIRAQTIFPALDIDLQELLSLTKDSKTLEDVKVVLKNNNQNLIADLL